jgi:cellulose synthase/poly-beta-1,6-N-acetylglucosamine synthase-like glycosyltransferase
MNSPFISIIIPCRNEENYISNCLDSVLAQDYPGDRMEILLADGMSTDGTKKIILDYEKKHPSVHYFENPKKIVTMGLNILIKHSKGELIARMDAHTEFPKDYISKCVKYIREYNVDNVGGVIVTLPGNNTLRAKAIAQAMSSAFGVGNAYFRTGTKEPRLVDTVPFGCFRKEVFERIGLFDEDMVRSQDAEFNLRLIKNGGKILLVPDIVSHYYARDSFIKMITMYAQYGYFKSLSAAKLGKVMGIRQMVPALFILSLLIFILGAFILKPLIWLFLFEIALYLMANLYFSFKISLKNNLLLLPFLSWSFVLIHFTFGFNYLRGIFDFWILKKHLHHRIADLPLTR